MSNTTQNSLFINNRDSNLATIQLDVRRLDQMLTVQNNIDKQSNKTNNKFQQIYPLIKTYFQKWLGQHQSNQPSTELFEYLITFIGTFLTLFIISIVHYRILTKHDLTFLISSFGASCVLIFAVPSSPLSQPRNAICGQLIGATIGCILRMIFTYIDAKFLAAALSVAMSILIMQLTKTLHAPAGATALNMIITPTEFPWYGFQYILVPTLSGTIIVLIIAVIINNLSPKRHYPLSWW